MSSIELDEAAGCLSELVARVQSGETIALTDGDTPVATLGPPPERRPGVFGSVKGEYWMSDDFDEPLDDLKDYA